jgi:secreted trypsin-like serine protease
MFKRTFLLLLFTTPLLLSAQTHDYVSEVLTVQKPSVAPKIIGGSPVGDSLRSNWSAKLIINNNQLCSGSIIGREWVLTAAHCIKNSLNQTANRIDIEPQDTNLPSLQAKAVFYHPDYNINDFYIYDIALIQLDTPIIGDFEPISLISSDEFIQMKTQFENTWVVDPDQPLPSNLYFSGYGLIDFESQKLPKSLMETYQSGIDLSYCNDNLLEMPIGNTSLLCSRYTEKENFSIPCSGDSGGGLIWQSKQNINDTNKGLRLVGITSGGDYSCESMIFYTNVEEWLLSIEEIIANNSDFPIVDEVTSISIDPFSEESKTDILRKKAPEPTPEENIVTESGGSINLWVILFLGLTLLWNKKSNKK